MSLRKYASGQVLEEDKEHKEAAKPSKWTVQDSAELKEENTK
jgi:hypothetical protein